MNAQHSPLLVTGAHRSGTTWVGKVLSLTPGTAYIHEPFNPTPKLHKSQISIPYWYMYVDSHNEDKYAPYIDSILAHCYPLGAALRQARSVKDFGRISLGFLKYTSQAAFHQRSIIKDPFALFSLSWFWRRFSIRPVIVIRHPAAVVASILKRGWMFPFWQWLNDDALIERYLRPFIHEIENAVQGKKSPLEQATLLWRVLYTAVAQYQASYAIDWIFIRHEDISLEPQKQFQQIFARLNLNWTPRVERFLRASTDERNPVKPGEGSVFDVFRASATNVKSWQKVLSSEDIKRVRQDTSEVSELFYRDADWL